MPIRWVAPFPILPCSADKTCSNPSRWFSTRLIARAKAGISPLSSPVRRSDVRICREDNRAHDSQEGSAQDDAGDGEVDDEAGDVRERRYERRGRAGRVEPELAENERQQRSGNGSERDHADQAAEHGE